MLLREVPCVVTLQGLDLCKVLQRDCVKWVLRRYNDVLRTLHTDTFDLAVAWDRAILKMTCFRALSIRIAQGTSGNFSCN